jgi:putative oxidoreductase
LLQDPEPLPYVEPAGVPHQSAAPVEIAPVDAEQRVKAAERRGTQDLGLLLLRVALGVVFIAHGLQKAFGWWGGSGLGGFTEDLTEAGYQHAELLTYVAAGAQIAAGVLLVLGLFTPVAAAVALAFLVNSVLVILMAQREDGGLFVLGSDAEYQLVLAALAAAIILVGPGRYGFDGGRGWARRPFIGSFLALLLGAGGGVAAWFFLHGINPFA